jgi:DNA-binding transcriptional regulator YiaG
MNRNRSLLKHFGCPGATDVVFWSKAHERESRRIRDAVESDRMVGVIAAFGSGKSELVRHSLNQTNYEIVYVNQPDRERLRIGQVTTAIVVTLSDESPKRDALARTYQLGRIAGEVAVRQKKTIVVVIENAHRLHTQTLLAIKDLRESVVFRGQYPLFSVVLIGQESLSSKLERFGEVRYRCKAIELSEATGWMTYADRVAYIYKVYGDVITRRSRERLAALFSKPLTLDHFIEEKLELMRDAGLSVLNEEQVPLSIREQREALQVSLREVSEISGVPKSTVSDTERGHNNDPETTRRIQAGLDQLAEARKIKAA